MMINYKGATTDDLSEDLRYSVPLRMFEILIGQYDHLTNTMDSNGKMLARLMVEGFEPDAEPNPELAKNEQELRVFTEEQKYYRSVWKMLGIENPTESDKQKYRELFPKLGTPADIKLFSPLHPISHTGASKVDAYKYYSHSPMGDIAKKILRQLTDPKGALKLPIANVEANIKSYGGQLSEWRLPRKWLRSKQNQEAWKTFVESVGGSIHAAVFDV